MMPPPKGGSFRKEGKMNVYAYQLYKTGLDPAYTNVYDGYASVTEYLMFLENFTKTGFINVPLPQRSIKEKNGNTFLVVSMKAVELIDTGYNYCCIQYTSDETSSARRLFYFITDVESLNDANSVNGIPSCRITLKYDAWSNNYIDYLKNDNHVQQVNRLSINHLISKDGNTKCVIPMSDVYTTNPISREIDYILGNGILWLGVRVSLEGTTFKIDDVEQDITIPSQSYCRILYYPLTYRGQESITLRDPINNRTIPISSGKWFSLPSWLNNARVLDSWVTYYGVATSFDGTHHNIVTSDGGIGTLSFEEGQSAICVYAYDAIYEATINVCNQIPNEPESHLGYDMLQAYSEELSIYPFKGTAIKVGDKEIPLKYNGIANYVIKVSRENSVVPKLTIIGKTAASEILMYEYPLNTTSFVVGNYVSSKEIFMLNNANQIRTKQMQQISNIIFGTVRAGAGAAAGVNGKDSTGTILSGAQQAADGAFNLANIDSQIRDADKALDNYYIPASIGTDDPYIDGVYKVNLSVNSEELRLPYFYDTHNNGSYCCTSATINSTNKKVFDCIRTDNCSLECVPNIVHRIELEQAFNRGVRKFHINAEFQHSVIQLNPSYGNPSNDMED